MSIADKFEVIADAVYDKGVSDGKQAGYDEFWDVVQDFGNRENYAYVFYHWNCEYIRPKYKVIPKAGKNNSYRCLHMCCNNPSLKKIEKEYFDLSQYESPTGYTSETSGNYYMFSACPNLEEIEDVGMKPYYYYATFAGCRKLHTIEVIRSHENTTFNPMVFRECTALENIKIEGVIAKDISFYQSPNLSKTSIESIINHLSDTTGATLTLSKTAVNNAFRINVDDASTFPEGSEYYNLRYSKANWSFNYV